jgi:hypothetical protein
MGMRRICCVLVRTALTPEIGVERRRKTASTAGADLPLSAHNGRFGPAEHNLAAPRFQENPNELGVRDPENRIGTRQLMTPWRGLLTRVMLA